MVYDKVVEILTASGVYFKVHHHEPVLTMQDVEEKLLFPKDRLLKTLVFRIRNSFWVFAVVEGQDRVDYRKLATAFGVNRDMVTRPSAEEVQSELELQIGGICPVPTNDNIAVVFDKKVVDKMGKDVIYCGVGKSDMSLEMKLQDLLAVSNARVWSITQATA